MMQLLLIWLSVMTFTVESKSAVSSAGEWPYDMEARYACTYQKGQVRAGDTATLHVSGLDGITIEKVDVYLKSNKSSGAGVLTMTMDGQEMWRMEGDYKSWFGDYNNSDFQPIGWSGAQTASTLDVQLVGTANSLHILKYEITWTQTPTQTYTVTLMQGDETYGSLQGAKVTLPWLDDVDEWQFAGWSENAFYETLDMPSNLLIGEIQPTADMTLWAVYQRDMTPPMPYETELYDGEFMYVERRHLYAMSGGVVNGMVDANSMDPYDNSQAYEISYDTDGRATIRLLYVYGEEYIGFDGTQLANTASKWNVYHDEDKTAFYTTVGNKTYMLMPGMWDMPNDTYLTKLIEVSNLEQTTTVLRSTRISAPLIYYTCHPEVPLATETVDAENGTEYIIPFGAYELIIQNGKKQLRLR